MAGRRGSADGVDPAVPRVVVAGAPAERHWGSSWSRQLLGYVAVAPVVLLLVALLVYPLLRTLNQSFYDVRPALRKNVYVGLDGFADLMAQPIFWTVFVNSLLWTVAVVAMQFGVGMLGAFVLNRAFPGRWLLRGLAILPWAIPGVVAAMVWRLLYDPQIGTLQIITGPLGLPPVDVLGRPGSALWGVIFAAVWKGFPFWMLIALAALQSVPREQVEAAAIDGAGHVGVFRNVMLPSMAPVIRIGVILTSIWTFNYFEMVYVMTAGGPVQSSHIFPTIIYEEAFRKLDFGDSSRYAVVSILLLFILAVFFVREARRSEAL
jgi:multiple sugar transport system permease protein